MMMPPNKGGGGVPPPRLKIAVLGGEGFLGARVVERLKATPDFFCASSSSSSSSSSSRNHRPHVVAEVESWDVSPAADRRVNVLDETQLNDAVEQFEPTTVIHCAGVVKFRRADAETLRRVNVQGTRNVLSSIRLGRSVRHLVYLSTVAVLGARRDDDDDDDDGQKKPLLTEENFSVGRTFERNPYTQSKQDAHELVLQFRKDNSHPNDVCVTIVLPGFLTGPNPNSAYWEKKTIPSRVPFGTVPLVDVRDVAKAIAMIVALQTTTTMTTTTTNAGRKKNVDGSSQITNTEYVVTGYNLSCRDFAEKLHELYTGGMQKKRIRNLPRFSKPLLLFLASLVDRFETVQTTLAQAEQSFLDRSCSSAKIAEKIHWKADFDIDDTLRHSVDSQRPVYLVVGASSGVGKEIVRELGREFCTVLAWSRRETTLDDFEFLDDMKRAIFASERVDCTSSASVAMAMKDIFKVYGRCDAVFMCVGKGCPHPLVETSDETMEDVVKSNVFSAFYVAKHYAAQLKTAASNKSRRRRRRGKLVAISSIAAFFAPSGFNLYAASKTCVSKMLNILKKEENAYLSVNVMHPFRIRTSFFREYRNQPPAWQCLEPALIARAAIARRGWFYVFYDVGNACRRLYQALAFALRYCFFCRARVLAAAAAERTNHPTSHPEKKEDVVVVEKVPECV